MIHLTRTQISRLYNPEKVTVNGLTFEFESEVEGKLIDYGTSDPYTDRYYRETDLFIKDQNNNRYKGIVMEFGDSSDDMQIGTGGAYFDKI